MLAASYSRVRPEPLAADRTRSLPGLWHGDASWSPRVGTDGWRSGQNAWVSFGKQGMVTSRKRRSVGYRPAFRHWRDLRWLVLYLAMLEPLAYLMWADYRKKAYKQLDELIPDWQHSMAWATSHVMGFDDDEAECPGHVPDWMLETSDLETKEEQAAPQSAPTGPLAQVENQGVDRVEDQQDVELVAVQATRPTPSVAIEAPEVEAPAHLTGGGDNLQIG